MTWRPLVGVDLVATVQVAEKLAGNASFWTVFLSEEEWLSARSSPRWLERVAGRWAAKEAVVKVIRPRRLDFALSDIHIRTEQGGAPAVELRGAAERAAAARGLSAWDLSITHTAGLAVAVAVARGDASPSASD